MPDPPVARFTYRAFISYSHRDKAWADWLHKALETYRVPSRLVGTETAHGVIPRRLSPVFRDRDDLSSAPELGSRIDAALAQSENLIVLCSPASASSRWVNEEVLAYKRMGRAARIFCVIVDGEPNATDLSGREPEECFCPALRFVIAADGRPTGERTEPVAADARPGKDGKLNAKLKLIAGMLDVGFDALKQREQQRRIRRMTAISTAAVCLMAVTGVLAIAALVSRHRAVLAQHQAQVAQQAAQRRQKQAEGLVNFMLGDLNDKLQEVNRLDIMQAVDDKAMAYFKSLPNTDVNDAALAQRAKALEKIGSVRLQQGNLSGALAAYRASVQIASRLAAEAPHDVARQVAYSRTLAFIGLANWQQGNLDAAAQAFETGRQVLYGLQRQAKDNATLLSQIQTLDNNIGHVLEAQGRLDAAETEYRATLAVSQRLVHLKPDAIDYASSLGDAYNNLGKLALERGDLANAIAQYQADNAIKARLSARDPNDNGQRQVALETRAILGRTLALAGDVQDGMRDLQQAVDSATKLVQTDPKATDFQDDLALYSTQLARLQRLQGALPAAKALGTRAVTILADLVAKDPNNDFWQGDYAAALTEQAAQLRAAGLDGAARRRVQDALHILEPMLAKHPDERGTLLAAMSAKLLLASLSGNGEVAQSLHTEVLQATRAAKTARRDPRLLALQVEALLALDRESASQPLVRQLWTQGYRDGGFVALLRRSHIAYPANPVFQHRIAAARPMDDPAASHPATHARRPNRLH